MDSGEPIDLEFRLGGPDLERFVVVGGDLEFLMSLPRDRLLTHTEIRLAAGVLRRLLVEDQTVPPASAHPAAPAARAVPAGQRPGRRAPGAVGH